MTIPNKHDWIFSSTVETCYNTICIHSALDYLSPAQFESDNPERSVRFPDLSTFSVCIILVGPAKQTAGTDAVPVLFLSPMLLVCCHQQSGNFFMSM